MSATKTPEGLSAAERASQLIKEGSKLNVHDVRARMAMAVPKPINAAADLKVGDDMDGSMVVLPVRLVKLYENNPRVTQNPRYAQIKESVRAQGVTNTISVTKRPGESAYVVAAGGNTRLMIVQELAAETGDPKWETMAFRFRAWRGEAAVLAAHLAENENRGDTSFWEKARGLAMLKAELEKDLARPLSAPDLHKEAKRLGMDFGVTMVRNLVFTQDCLASIGPWLTARSVKETLQPAYTGLQGVLTALTRLSAEDVRRLFDGVLQEQAGYVAHQQELVSDDEASPLDIAELVQALTEATAKAADVPAARLPLMLTARANNPRMTADELRSLARQVAGPGPTAAQAAMPPLAPSAVQAAHAGTQMPLQPAFLGAVAPAAAVAPTRPESPAGPLQGLGNPTQGDDASDDELAATAERFGRGVLSERSEAGHLLRLISTAVADIGTAAELHDVLSLCQAMPLAFFVELPEAGIDSVNGDPPEDPDLRRATWHVLAALSGQWLPAVARQIPADQSRWRLLLDNGDLARQAALLTLSGRDSLGHNTFSAQDATRVFFHPHIGPALGLIEQHIAQLRLCAPERFVAMDQALGNGGR